MYRVRSAVAFVCVLGVLAGCSVMDSAVDDRFGDLNRSAGKARNESVLLNIARASERIPLTFVTFQKLSGGLQAQVSGGMPSFSLGPHGPTAAVQRDISVGNTTLGGGSSASNAVDMTIIETKDFYHALLDPGDLITFYHFLGAYPRELLFWLFVDSVRVKVFSRTSQKVFNVREAGLKPLELFELQNRPTVGQSCRETSVGPLCFRDMVDLAMLTGVSIQTQDPLPKPANAVSKAAQGKKDATLSSGEEARICLDAFLSMQTNAFVRENKPEYYRHMSKGLKTLLAATRETAQHATIPTCYTSGRFPLDPVYPDRLMLRSVTATHVYEYEIRTRSTFAIYQYLGSILAEDASANVVVSGLEPDTWKHPRILNIVTGRTEHCAVTTSLRNKTYCIPEEDSDLTKQIFSLISQLINLKIRVDDVGLTPTFRVIGP